MNLFNIFVDFGAPVILQSDNGREFVAEIIEELKLIWPGMNIVHVKPRHPQSQGSNERRNQDIKKMVSIWLQENNSKQWSQAIKFVKVQKNCATHWGIKAAPYKCLFGIDLNVGIASVNIPKHILETLRTEEDLELLNNSSSLNKSLPESEAPAIDSPLESDEANLNDTDQPFPDRVLLAQNERKRIRTEEIRKDCKISLDKQASKMLK